MRPAGATTIGFVTAARDEARNLPALLHAMAHQTRRADRWVIVDDGSGDGTAALLAGVDPALAVVVHRGHDEPRSFASKVRAVEAGLAALGPSRPDLVGCLDADLLVPTDLVERLVGAFDADPRLGVAGAAYRHPVRGRLRPGGGPPTEVPGAAQVFRGEVFEAIGGYERLPHGGEDTVANAAARALGWETRVVDGLVVDQQRRQGSVSASTRWGRLVRQGRCDHDIGTLASFEILKAVRRLGEPPVVVSSVARLAGYTAEALHRRPPAASPPAVARIRAEQRSRMRPWR